MLRRIVNTRLQTRPLQHSGLLISFSKVQTQLDAEWDPKVNPQLKKTDYLLPDHTPVDAVDEAHMLATVGAESMQSLLQEVIPVSVRDPQDLKKHDLGNMEPPMPVDLLHRKMKEVISKNKLYKSYIGAGFYGTIVPHSIERNFLSNPSWYTAYTPYQPEISQGRLHGLMVYQELCRKLTEFEISGASLLDEASAASEAMLLSYANGKKKLLKYYIDENVFPASINVTKTSAHHLGVEVVVTNLETVPAEDLSEACGVMMQSPDNLGRLRDWTSTIARFRAINKDITVAVGTDLAALMLFKTPGSMGADIAFGNTQRFGVPMGYGGPAAAFFCTHKKNIRKLPGRIIGVSKDSQGSQAYRMALQTREQHIRREKATSNICTAQALLANMAGFYSVYHGEEGLKNISSKIYYQTQLLAQALTKLGFELIEKTNFFDTISFRDGSNFVYKYCQKREINLRMVSEKVTAISLDQTVTHQDLRDLITVLAAAKKQSGEQASGLIANLETKSRTVQVDQSLLRGGDPQARILENSIFHSIKGEHEIMRYLKYLENKDISLTKSMISLGSCTMKLNAATEMIPLTWPEFNLHPYVPLNQAEGYTEMISELREDLKKCTRMDDVNFNPNSGAAGEYSGLLAIRNYQHSIGQGHRDICLIPASAHGTNPASAIRAGMKVVVIKSDDQGNIDLEDLSSNCKKYAEGLSAIMITYPSTHGVYEDAVRAAIDTVHEFGGQVYLDGANMNAQVGLTSPGYLDADVCHLNLHKTFCIPHGGGGPGMGPICVKAHLSPFCPSFNNPEAPTGPISSSEYSSASILSISYLYIKAMGFQLTKNTEIAILNANYMKQRLQEYYPILYTNEHGRVAHEFLMDLRPLKKATGISEEDVAKRLMDFGFHSPTMSFPVAGTMMIEPTESETVQELDRLVEALIRIREEIAKVADGSYDALDNPLKNAPHTAEMITANRWKHAYSREEAAYPLGWVQARGKYWPPVGRIDNVYGDRNLDMELPDNYSFLQ